MKKKMWSKGIAAVLAGAMVMTSLTACGGTDQEASKGSDKNGTTLSMTWWGNQVRNERTQAALDKYHEMHPEVTVEGQFFQWDDYWSKLATSAAGKKMQDLVQMDISYLDQYVAKNQLLDLTPYIESGALNAENIPDNVLEMGVVGEGNYGIASGVNAPVIFYNKTLLEDNGLEFKDNSTLDEFIELSKQVYEKTGYRTSLGGSANYMEHWSRGQGLPLVDRKIDGTAEDYVDYFKVKEQGIKEGWFIPQEYSPSSGGAVEEDPLVYGSSPETMVWCNLAGGSNMLTAYQSAAPEGVEIGITTIPTNDPKKSNYLKPSMFFSISADTKNPDAAVAVLDYLINSKEANEILLGERGIPASTKVAEEINPLISETEQKITKFVNEVVAVNCSPINPPAPEGNSEVTDVLKKLEEKIGYGECTAEEAAKEYFEKGNEIYSSK